MLLVFNSGARTHISNDLYATTNVDLQSSRSVCPLLQCIALDFVRRAIRPRPRLTGNGRVPLRRTRHYDMYDATLCLSFHSRTGLKIPSDPASSTFVQPRHPTTAPPPLQHVDSTRTCSITCRLQSSFRPRLLAACLLFTVAVSLVVSTRVYLPALRTLHFPYYPPPPPPRCRISFRRSASPTR